MWADPDRQTGSIAEKTSNHPTEKFRAAVRPRGRVSEGVAERERDTTADSLVEGVLAVLPIYLDGFFLSQKTNMSR